MNQAPVILVIPASNLKEKNMSDYSINGKNAFISGANRGIGKALVEELLAGGVQKVYAGSRDVSKLEPLVQKYGEQIIPVQLDVIDRASIQSAADQAQDVDILINNAGVAQFGGVFSENGEQLMDEIFNVNVRGVLLLTRALVQSIKERNGVIANVSSVAGLANMPIFGTYSATKAMLHSFTQSMRVELQEANVHVMGIYPGPIDTDMTKEMEMEKASPQTAARSIVEAIIAQKEDVFPDPMAEEVAKGFFADPKGIEKQFASFS